MACDPNPDIQCPHCGACHQPAGGESDPVICPHCAGSLPTPRARRNSDPRRAHSGRQRAEPL